MVSNRVQKPRQLAAQLLSFALVLSTTFIVIAPVSKGSRDSTTNAELVDMEGHVRSDRLALSNCRRPFRLHGTRLPARRLGDSEQS